MWDIPPENVPGAIMWEAIGQCFAVIGMALAKWSLGLFLLRLVNQTWHKVSIWLVMGALMGASVSVCFVFMLQCSPPAYLWDRSIPGGHCDLNATPVSLTLTSTCPISCNYSRVFIRLPNGECHRLDGVSLVRTGSILTNSKSFASSPISSLLSCRGFSFGNST